MYVNITAELHFEPDTHAVEDAWLERNPGKELPADLEEDPAYMEIVRELCEKASQGVYIGCGNGSTGGLLCAGSLVGGTLEFMGHDCQVQG